MQKIVNFAIFSDFRAKSLIFVVFCISDGTLSAYNFTKHRVCSIGNVFLVIIMPLATSLKVQGIRKARPQHRFDTGKTLFSLYSHQSA